MAIFRRFYGISEPSSQHAPLLTLVNHLIPCLLFFQLWDITNKKCINTYNGHKSWVHAVDFSPDASQLVSGSADETVKVMSIILPNDISQPSQAENIILL